MSQDEAESARAQQPAAADEPQSEAAAKAKEDSGLAMQNNDTNASQANPAKAETAIVTQAPFETRVMFEDDEWGLPDAIVAPLTDEDLAERARAEEDMRQRREAARLDEEQRIADSKKPTVISNPTWPVIPTEPTKTYDFSAVQLVADMNVDDDPPPQTPSAFAAIVPSAPPPPPAEPEIDDEPLVIEEPQQIFGPDQTFGAYDPVMPMAQAAQAPPASAQAPASAVAQPAPAKARPPKADVSTSGGFADWIHTYRLPIITFLIGVVVGVFIAFLF
jgi:hypothetical protein